MSTSHDRRQAAREKARKLADDEERRRKRQVLVSTSVGAIVILAVVVVISLVVSGQARPIEGASPSPANKQGGITLVSGTDVAAGNLGQIDLKDTPEPATQDGAPSTPPGAEASPDGDPARVVIYADANCIHCLKFEQQYGETLADWLEDGSITLEYRLLNFQDGASADKYSTRAAAATACVADTDPSSYLKYVEALFSDRDSEWSNEQLIALGANFNVDIEDCVNDGTFTPFVNYTTAMAQHAGIHKTPSVWIEGQQWTSGNFTNWAGQIIDQR